MLGLRLGQLGAGGGMGLGEGLADGARVAVVGGGLSAVAFAAALGIAGRQRGRTFSIHVHDGNGPGRPRGPVNLTPACRTHLSALGCRVPQEWSHRRFSRVELHQNGRVHALPAPPAPTWWLPDSAPLRQALAASASMHGAIFLGRRVEAWQRTPARDEAGAQRGEWVVRAAGRSDRYHAVVLATGARATSRPPGWPGYRPPPGLSSYSVRLTGAEPEGNTPVRVLLLPSPGTTVLELYPERAGWFARAWGPGVTPAGFGGALLHAFEAGALPEGLVPGMPARAWRSAGVAKVPASEGRLAVGEAALGHPLEHGLATLLESCSSAAHALVTNGPTSPGLVRDVVRAQRGAELRARDAVSAVRWIHRSGAGALEAFARAEEESPPWGASVPGCLGLPAPTPRALGVAAAAVCTRRLFRQIIAPGLPPIPRPRPVGAVPHLLAVEPDLRRATALAEALAARGASATFLPDGLSLLRDLGGTWPAAIVLGRNLPWLDPVSLCEALRAHPGGASVPILVLGVPGLGHARRMLGRLGALWLEGEEAAPANVARLLVPDPLRLKEPSPHASVSGA